jgi:two-component system, chemotaxis family, chemotaxis protein CheY
MTPHSILVADEDLDTRIILRTLLEQRGYDVMEAGSATAAIEAAQQPLSLVILNHPMSIAEDLSLATWLRNQPGTRQTPIINLTSRPMPALMDEATRQGVNVTLAKPLDVQLVLNLVSELTAR